MFIKKILSWFKTRRGDTPIEDTLTPEQEAEFESFERGVDTFVEMMKLRFKEKLKQGKTGWEDPHKVLSSEIRIKLRDDINTLSSNNEHLTSQLTVDIANRAFMLWSRLIKTVSLSNSRFSGCSPSFYKKPSSPVNFEEETAKAPISLNRWMDVK